MSELLKELENSGLFSHIEGKKNIKKLVPFIRNSSRADNRGVPSYYALSANAEQLIKLFAKRNVKEIIISSLNRTKILPNVLKFATLSFFNIVKDIKQQELYNFFISLGNQDSNRVKEVTDGLIALQSQISQLPESKLEELAQNAVDSTIQNTDNIDESLFRLFTLINVYEN